MINDVFQKINEAPMSYEAYTAGFTSHVLDALWNAPKTAEVNGSKLVFGYCRSGHGEKTVELRLLQGEWPSDADLITIADDYRDRDGNVELIPRHYGGIVRHTSPDRAVVTVYID